MSCTTVAGTARQFYCSFFFLCGNHAFMHQRFSHTIQSRRQLISFLLFTIFTPPSFCVLRNAKSRRLAGPVKTISSHAIRLSRFWASTTSSLRVQRQFYFRHSFVKASNRKNRNRSQHFWRLAKNYREICFGLYFPAGVVCDRYNRRKQKNNYTQKNRKSSWNTYLKR